MSRGRAPQALGPPIQRAGKMPGTTTPIKNACELKPAKMVRAEPREEAVPGRGNNTCKAVKMYINVVSGERHIEHTMA